MKASSLLLLLYALLISCEPANQESSENPVAVEPSEYRSERFYASFGNCQKEDEGCTYFEVAYPVYDDSELSKINQFVNEIKSPVFDPDLKMLPLDSIANDFINNYTEFQRDFPENSQTWYMEHLIKVEHESDSSILLSAAISEFGGGAHGNYSINYYQVEKSSGRSIQLSDLYSQEEVDRMSTILSVSINPEISLLTETIRPNDNFILSQDSITFVYNPYEIAPYSEGVIRISLPRDQSPIM